MVPVAPKNNILVTLDSKFRDTTDGGIIIDTGFRPGHHATVTGKVVSVPLGMSDHPQKKVINMEVKAGDDLAFAYSVVYNQETKTNADDVYTIDPMISPFVTSWSNQNGKRLIRRKLQNGMWEAALMVVSRTEKLIIDKVTGRQRDINDFVGKYMPDRNHFIRYKNCLWYGEDEFWMVDYQQAFMVRRRNDFIMIGGYALLEHQQIERNDYTGNIELWGDGRRDINPRLETKLIAIGTPLKGRPKLSVKPGDTVIVDQRTAQEYNFWGNDYLLVRQDQILAKA